MDCKKLSSGWLGSSSSSQTESESDLDKIQKPELTPEEKALQELEKKLRSKRNKLTGHNLTRHQAVLGFLRYQKMTNGQDTRENISLAVARFFGKGIYFARKIITWERQWKANRKIEMGKRGCFVKTRSWLSDEGVQLHVREWLAGAKEKDITGYGLAKVIGQYLSSTRAMNILDESPGKGRNRIRARTARN